MGNNQLTPRINRIENNVIIDGSHDFWFNQSPSIANNTSGYGSSLFKFSNTSTGIACTLSQSSTVPSQAGLPSAFRVNKTAAGSVAAGTVTNIDYYIEGFDVQKIYDTEFTLVFWVRSSTTGQRALSIRNGASTHSYVGIYTINQANTYELKAVKFNALNTCPGSISRDNAAGAIISWGIATGTNFQTSTLNQWISGAFFGITGQDTTWVSGTTHEFFLCGVMCLPGDWTSLASNPSSYKYVRCNPTVGQELHAINRYVERFGGDNTGTNSQLGTGFSTGATAAQLSLLFRVNKRTSPSIVYSALNVFRYNNAGINATSTNMTTLGTTPSSAFITLTTSGISGSQLPGTFDVIASVNNYLLVDARF